MTYPVEQWTAPELLRDGAFDYWNDDAIEADKVWNVAQSGGFERMERYLAETGLLGLLDAALHGLRAAGRQLKGTGADLASGTCWAASRLLAAGGIDRLYCVEYSQPRLLNLAPKVLAHDRVPFDKVTLCVGSFYELRLPPQSLDFVFLSQAFHHADRPSALLDEIRRVLKVDGTAIIIGEHVVPSLPLLYARHVALGLASRLIPGSVQRRLRGRVLARKPIVSSPARLLAPDPVTGDHYYRAREYASMFEASGFSFKPVYDRSRGMGSPAMFGYLLHPRS